jgi:hypothetical protein
MRDDVTPALCTVFSKAAVYVGRIFLMIECCGNNRQNLMLAFMRRTALYSISSTKYRTSFGDVCMRQINKKPCSHKSPQAENYDLSENIWTAALQCCA